jgi:hypothetical protein
MLLFKLLKMYIILNSLYYSLFLSILFNNYKAIYFINNKSLFIYSFFIKAKSLKYIKAGLLSLLIIN